MVPEISHRCPGCGASTHDFGEGVLFCPECGKPLAAAAQAQASEAKQPAPEAVATASVGSSATAESDRPQTDSPASPGSTGRADQEHIGARERTRQTLQRASQRTRGAIEDNVKRVEKLHDVSSAMLEDAHYDPSLRFVLVALGLFILFVILLVLSKVMG
jgi:uncharacterized Zn finger protein (UPF0148 family)